ncbi:PepSY-associated TM helix domain-containing protein [Flavobacterium qiangtangense]|uniref:PepSY-associated TM helix domain-containing protein n=1 Tax=Flavobacterium qiangtangense TaxID=1442595 RepID=A0ABW1PHT8_9FLAO
MSKKKKGFKHWIGKLHLWLGMASGLIVLILSVTGCIYVFSVEITEALRDDVMYVSEVKTEPIAVSKLWDDTQKKIGDQFKISSVKVSKDPQKTYIFGCYKGNEDGITYFGSIDYYKSIYVNPYSGEILKIYDEEMDFFNIVKFIHWSLLISGDIGQQIVGWSTFIFVIMLITGIILWWPKNKAARKQRFKFQWKKTTQWKRKNYDIHNIFGFYIATIAIIIAFTGMVWAFTWFQGLVYVVGSGTMTPPEIVEKKADKNLPKLLNAMETALEKTKIEYPDADAFSLAKPADSLANVNIYVQQNQNTYYVSHEMRFAQSGEILLNRSHSEKNFGEKLITANYDIHVGAILGIPGKIIAFIASFICGMLPVTGFLIWYGRTFKKSKAKK